MQHTCTRLLQRLGHQDIAIGQDLDPAGMDQIAGEGIDLQAGRDGRQMAVRPAVRAVSERWGGSEGQSRRGRKRQKQQLRGGAGVPPPQLPPDLVPEAGREEELATRLEAGGQLARATEAAVVLGAEDPAVLMSRPLKPLRAALQPYADAYLDEVAGGAAARASSALWDGRAETALEALRELRAAGHAPRLGSVQRWVRDCMNFGDNAALQTPRAVDLPPE